MKLGEYIKQERTRRGYTLESLSDEVEISVQYLGMLERGERTNPRWEVLSRIAKILRLDLVKVYTENHQVIR